MEKQTITAMFDDYKDAVEAVRRLKTIGVADADISLVGGDSTMRSASDVADDSGSGAGTGATLGATLGGGAGLLAGLGLMAIPGVGPVVAAGWLVSTLVGVAAGGAIGAATGGLIGALSNAGVSEDDAHAYAEGVRRGGTLVTARVEHALVSNAVDVLDDEGTVNMDERVTTWRNEGWNGRYGDSAPGSPGSMNTSPPVTPVHRPVGADGTTVPIVDEHNPAGRRDMSGNRVKVYGDRPASASDMKDRVGLPRDQSDHLTDAEREAMRKTEIELDDQRRRDLDSKRQA